MSYQKYKDAIKATNNARRLATRRLIANHRKEFDLLYLEEATKMGLNPTKTRAQVTKGEEAENVISI